MEVFCSFYGLLRDLVLGNLLKLRLHKSYKLYEVVFLQIHSEIPRGLDIFCGRPC